MKFLHTYSAVILLAETKYVTFVVIFEVYHFIMCYIIVAKSKN